MTRSRWWAMVPRPLRAFPADLTAIVAVVACTILSIALPIVRESPVRIVFGLAYVLFVPGYAFIAALFPEAGTGPTAGDAPTGRRERGIDGIERVALSFGLSIAIVPLIGLVLNFTPWGIRLGPILVAVSGFTLVATAVAAIRRWELPPDERFAVPYRAWYAAGRAELLAPPTRTDAILNVVLVLSVVLAVSSVAYAVAVPKPGEAFTELYILTEDDEGELVAADYPTEFTRGETRPLVVGVGNHEHERVTYGVAVVLQNVSFVDNETVVHRSAELDRWRVTLADNETAHRRYGVTPTYTGTRLRLAVLLYEGDPPAEPSVETAYRETHLWINVTETG